jgi:hypothetical protein
MRTKRAGSPRPVSLFKRMHNLAPARRSQRHAREACPSKGGWSATISAGAIAAPPIVTAEMAAFRYSERGQFPWLSKAPSAAHCSERPFSSHKRLSS